MNKLEQALHAVYLQGLGSEFNWVSSMVLAVDVDKSLHSKLVGFNALTLLALNDINNATSISTVN